MKKIIVPSVSVLLSTALLLIGNYLLVHASSNATTVCGAINSDTTWIAANSPYEVCSGGVTVAYSMTLTIQPGVTVLFQTNSRLLVNGALAASGTPTQMITFTAVTASPGSWSGIFADSVATTPALVSLSYATIEFAGIDNSYGGQVVVDHALAILDHTLIRNGKRSGVYAGSSARIDLQDTRLIGNSAEAVKLIQPESDPKLVSLTAAGNGLNAVYIGGTTYLRGQHRWPASGLPYVIDAVFGNFSGDSLAIEPGSELQFTSNGWLNIGGEFKAIGLPGAPITLTGQTKTPGAWNGLVLYGVQTPATAKLDYVTVEYGGRNTNGANITVDNGYLVAHNTTIRNSQKDGVRINSKGHGTLLNSQIAGNPSYGIRNTQTSQWVLASNNWWGDANGPTSDLPSCSQGLGDRVSAGVMFRPVLTATNITRPFPLSDAPNLTLTPRRWFAPADGMTKVYFDITLHDGNGAPLPGRKVRLSTSLGVVVDGGITDLNGKTLAYLVSNSVGDAEVIAGLDSVNTCEGAMSPSSKITFTMPIDVTDLFPDSPSSYFDGNISVSPLPVVVGVPATIQVRLTNPLTVPITLDVSFGFAQSGIGLAFGPIKDIVGQVIPAKSSVTLSASFLPVVSGHYCVQVSYTITAIGTARQSSPQAGGSGLKQMNLYTHQGPMGTPNDKDILDRADKSWNLVSKLPLQVAKIQKAILGLLWGWQKDTSKNITQNLGSDPPRQDYDQATLPVWYPTAPIQPDAKISAMRAAAINAVCDALADVNAYGVAAVVALDRYGGASEAYDLSWAAQQASARLYYQEQMGAALLTYADRLESFVQVLINEGETDTDITVGDVIAYQQQLASQGFSEEEKAKARSVGLSEAEIEAYRQGIIATDPSEIAGNILDMYLQEAGISRELGNALLHPYSYSPGFSISGGAGLRIATASGNSMAQIGNTVTTLQVSNPLSQTTQVDLHTRRIDLPADWMVSVSPAQISLAPGEQTTVTVSILSGSPVPQNSKPRVAVEGYAGSQLLGGVVIEVIVPRYALFDGKYHSYVPLVSR
jgi:hypothetical protein